MRAQVDTQEQYAEPLTTGGGGWKSIGRHWKLNVYQANRVGSGAPVEWESWDYECQNKAEDKRGARQREGLILDWKT